MIDLDERLQDLAEGIELPGTTPDDDLARGRARLRRRHLGTAGAALTTVAAIGISVVLLSGGGMRQGVAPGFAGSSGSPDRLARAQDAAQRAEVLQQRADAARRQAEQLQAREAVGRIRRRQIDAALAGYRDILREDLDPAGRHIQLGPITNEQGADDALGTKLTWNGGGMLQVAVGGSLEGVQFFCDTPCTEQPVAGGSKALVISTPGRMSVAVFQDDGDIVALTASTSFGNNGTATGHLGLTVDQLLAAAADPRLDLPASTDQPSGAVGTQ